MKSMVSEYVGKPEKARVRLLSYVDIVGVTGSIPVAPTIKDEGLEQSSAIGSNSRKQERGSGAAERPNRILPS
jgi:hypothetical protein